MAIAESLFLILSQWMNDLKTRHCALKQIFTYMLELELLISHLLH
jgi:hypothetical protein